MRHFGPQVGGFDIVLLVISIDRIEEESLIEINRILNKNSLMSIFKTSHNGSLNQWNSVPKRRTFRMYAILLGD